MIYILLIYLTTLITPFIIVAITLYSICHDCGGLVLRNDMCDRTEYIHTRHSYSVRICMDCSKPSCGVFKNERGVFKNSNGSYTALTYSRSRTFKASNRAHTWYNRVK